MEVRGDEERTCGLRDQRLIQDGGMVEPGVRGTTVADRHFVSRAEKEIDRGVPDGLRDGRRVESLRTGVGGRVQGGMDLSPLVSSGPKERAGSGRVAGSVMMHPEASGSTQSSNRWTQVVVQGRVRTDVKGVSLFMEEGVTRSERRRMAREDPTRRFRKGLEWLHRR